MNGLQLELFVGKRDDFDSLSYSKGAKIFVYNHSTVYSDADSIDVSIAQETNINLHKTLVSKLKKPYSDCEIYTHELNSSTSEFVQTFNRLNFTYRQNDCLNMCYQKLLVKKCECFDFSVSGFNFFLKAVKSCSLAEISCMEKIFRDPVMNYYDSCRQFCPKECDSVEYGFDVSFSDYPTETRMKSILTDNVYLKSFETNLKNKLLKTNIHFNKLTYEIITETAATSFGSLLANIGGTMGLFMGFSVLTMFEVLELFFALTFVTSEIIIELIKYYIKTNHETCSTPTKNPV